MDPTHAHLPWRRASWRRSVNRWIGEQLGARRERASGPVRQVHLRPWSIVLRVSTNRGRRYFKATSQYLANEPRLVEALAARTPLVPAPLVIDAERRWMLMAESGQRLRELSLEARLGHWERLLPRYAELQRSLLGRGAELLALGALDRRLGGLERQVAALLDDPGATQVGAPGGLTGSELRRLRDLLPDVAAQCAEAAATTIGESIQHDDLHDANVFVARGGSQILDWGDACVAHPFSTLGVTLPALAAGSGLELGSPQITRLRDAYLEAWADGGGRRELGEALDAVLRVRPLSRALTWHAALATLPPGVPHEDRGAPVELLRAWLAPNHRRR